MERDDSRHTTTDKAEVVPAEEPQVEEAVAAAAAAHIQVKDFSSAPPSQDDAVQGGQESQARGSLGDEPASVVLAVDSGPGFVDVNGDVGGPGHNETVVDVIAVPCPGADPVQTWMFGHEAYTDASVPSETGSRSSLRRPGPWVTRELRMAANIARVFLYRHRALEDGMTLESLSEDLLDQVERIRNGAVGVLARSCSRGCHADLQLRSRVLCFLSAIALAAWSSKRLWSWPVSLLATRR